MEIHRVINGPRLDNLLRGNLGRKEQLITLEETYHLSMNFLAPTPKDATKLLYEARNI